MADLSFFKKNALKTAEMSGKRAKYRHFSYIKQNSIAETQSTMESFWVERVRCKAIIQKRNRPKQNFAVLFRSSLCYLDKIDAIPVCFKPQFLF
jgi:hypothetical protein